MDELDIRREANKACEEMIRSTGAPEKAVRMLRRGGQAISHPGQVWQFAVRI